MNHPVRLVCVLLACGVIASAKHAASDVSMFADVSVWRLHNRAATDVPDRPGAVRLDARNGDGVMWLVSSDFNEGTIEFDVRGADKSGQSFVGVAFRGVDDTTYDAVYFRPFNFKNPEEPRRARAVQYISMPDHPWQRLREEHPGKYEAAVNPVPDPDGWFHALVVIADRTIKVFVNGAKEPSLMVTELSNRTNGRIGLWVGNGSAGDFANLTIAPPQKP